MTDTTTIHEWQGFTFKIGERGMYWVSERGVNPMPGACCFRTPESAKQGIAALLLTREILRGKSDENGPAAEGRVF